MLCLLAHGVLGSTCSAPWPVPGTSFAPTSPAWGWSRSAFARGTSSGAGSPSLTMEAARGAGVATRGAAWPCHQQWTMLLAFGSETLVVSWV